MTGRSNWLETKDLNRRFRRSTTAVSGSNASTTNILVTSSADFSAGDIVKLTTPGSFHLVTAIPDGTHITISPAAAAAPTTGNVEAWGYAPAGVWVALFTAAPSDAGGGTEVAGGSYGRAQVTQADGSWAAPSGTPRATSNSGAVTFPAPTANWGQVTHFGYFDAQTGGNWLGYWGALSSPKNINNGDPAPSFAIGALALSED